MCETLLATIRHIDVIEPDRRSKVFWKSRRKIGKRQPTLNDESGRRFDCDDCGAPWQLKKPLFCANGSTANEDWWGWVYVVRNHRNVLTLSCAIRRVLSAAVCCCCCWRNIVPLSRQLSINTSTIEAKMALPFPFCFVSSYSSFSGGQNARSQKRTNRKISSTPSVIFTAAAEIIE